MFQQATCWNQCSCREFVEKLSNAEVTMWVAVTSIGFGAAIGLNVFALWLTDRFGQLQKTDEELREGGWAIFAY